MNIFSIRFIKDVVFTDMYGTVLKTYAIGDTADATGPFGNPSMPYFSTGMGGVYTDEAVKIDTENK